MPPYLSIPSALRHEIDPILGSRFVADVAPASDATSALELVERVRAEFPDASHHCWAWRLPPAGIDFRYSDDGEPRGSAGVPILKRIEGAGLVGVCAVVTRWVGGTQLGVGGLMRAYGGAAAAALAEVGSVEVVPTTPCTVVYPYECEGNVQALLAAHPWRPFESDFGAEITLRFQIPEDDCGRFEALFGDATAGRAQVTPGV